MRSSNKGKTKQKSKLQTACLLGNIWFSKDDSKHKSVSLQCLLSFLLKQTSIKSSTAVSIHLNLFSHSFFSQSNSNPPKFGQITQGEQKCDVCHNPDLFYSVSHNCIAPRNYDWYDIKIESHLCCPINFWLIWIRQKQKKIKLADSNTLNSQYLFLGGYKIMRHTLWSKESKSVTLCDYPMKDDV